jgi:hypothetical protein
MSFPKTQEQAIEQGITMLNTEEKKNMHDVKLYLRERLFADCVAPKELEYFVERVAEMSEGLFLYLRFLDEVINKILLRNKSKVLVMNDLKRFPNAGYVLHPSRWLIGCLEMLMRWKRQR